VAQPNRRRSTGVRPFGAQVALTDERGELLSLWKTIHAPRRRACFFYPGQVAIAASPRSIAHCAGRCPAPAQPLAQDRPVLSLGVPDPGYRVNPLGHPCQRSHLSRERRSPYQTVARPTTRARKDCPTPKDNSPAVTHPITERSLIVPAIVHSQGGAPIVSEARDEFGERG
jgi:hypothetical protein